MLIWRVPEFLDLGHFLSKLFSGRLKRLGFNGLRVLRVLGFQFRELRVPGFQAQPANPSIWWFGAQWFGGFFFGGVSDEQVKPGFEIPKSIQTTNKGLAEIPEFLRLSHFLGRPF